MGELTVYRAKDASPNRAFKHVGTYPGSHIPTVLETEDVARDLGEGTHEVFAVWGWDPELRYPPYGKLFRVTVHPFDRPETEVDHV